MEQSDLAGIGLNLQPQEQMRLASLTQNSGLDGVVCSAQEASLLKGELSRSSSDSVFIPVGADVGDQKRIMTPVQAVKLPDS